jgi:DNA invertase Pin-like site-specific DNA recombinase
MQAAIGYLRVSTREQGRSGLGLAAQRFEIETFGKREGFTVKSWHQDVQAGASLLSEHTRHNIGSQFSYERNPGQNVHFPDPGISEALGL